MDDDTRVKCEAYRDEYNNERPHSSIGDKAPVEFMKSIGQPAIYQLMVENLGHPASQVYVESYYSDEAKAALLDMIERIKAVLRSRIKNSEWLSESTRAAALEKVDKFYYKVGYLDNWIDYSGVDIGPTDPVASMVALGAFDIQRQLDVLARPPEHEELNGESTLPIAMNAAYFPIIMCFSTWTRGTRPSASRMETRCGFRPRSARVPGKAWHQT